MVTASKIRKARARLGESQAAFGDRFRVDQSTVHRWEKDGPPKRGATSIVLERFLREEFGNTDSLAGHQ